ncbi:FtsX-like permease family protein [Candidatus Poribacteria bacterium]|nr:FtsX-like permease family protein [Candidatus Poribacteria bacterium]
MRYLFGESLLNIRHSGAVGVLAVFIVALTTVLFGALSLIQNVVRGEVARFEDNPAMVAFIEDTVPDSDVQALGTALESLPGVARIVIVSKDQALARSRDIFGEQSDLLLEGFERDNPLPRSVEIYPLPQSRRTQTLDALETHLKTLPGVESVLYEQRDIAIMQQVKGVVFLLGVLVALISVVVISFSIMLTIYARRDELAILQLVGATIGFIRAPLVLQGCFEGLIGSEIGMGLFYLLFRRFGPGVGLVEFLSAEQILTITGGATAVGLIAALIPLRSHLRLQPS